MIRGQSGQVVGVQMINASTGNAFVGTVTCYITVDNGPQSIGGVSAGVCTAEGNGLYSYTPTAIETNGTLVAFTFIGNGAIPSTRVVLTGPFYKATVGQVVGAQVVNATNGAVFVGTVTVYVTVDGGVQAIGTVGAGIATSKGNGYFTYAPSAAETNGNELAFTFTGTNAIGTTFELATTLVTPSTAMAPVPASQICTDALTEIRYARAGDVVSAEDMAFTFQKLLRLIDRWNADATAPFTNAFTAYTPTPLQQPHTLGPSGNWVTAQRPLYIKHANLILPATGNSGPIRVPIRVRDDDWWARNRTRGIATAIPTDLYYSMDWPNGNVYLWPVPTMTYQVELETDTLIGGLLLTTLFTMPYGYRDAITLTLAMECAPAFGQTISPDTRASCRQAQALIFGRNQQSPDLNTRDAGMPGGSGHRGRFNYLTGEVD